MTNTCSCFNLSEQVTIHRSEIKREGKRVLGLVVWRVRNWEESEGKMQVYIEELRVVEGKSKVAVKLCPRLKRKEGRKEGGGETSWDC